ncbi:hypothetical protein EPUL_005506 [Erysiphe pulchra]|uniref:FAS1 domain-containing protein n=1 Tax=Erysiphe pulchra TaxID=225359 RepID=A0A2S4PWP3_9PEZI|nr:hypothetical protein EPUL_005506 [Erysiphe pulchra]
MIYNKLIPFGFALTAVATTVTDMISRNPNTSSLNKLLQQLPEIASALDRARSITVLAPSNAAFDAFLRTNAGAAAASQPDVIANLLNYHVLTSTYMASNFSNVPVFPRTLLTNSSYTSLREGQRVKIEAANNSVTVTSGLLNTSCVVTPDITASNGVIHIIDSVLTIPVSITATAIVAHLDNLVGALRKADLDDTVNDLPKTTIFAPSDAAFSNASRSLTRLSDGRLKELLKYHVLSKVKYSTDLADESDVENINGKEIHIEKDNYMIEVNSANVISSDVLVSNGVVHVIDEVLSVNSDNDHKHDHDGHDHDHDDDDDDRHSAAGPGAKISKHDVIALGTFILAQLFAL